MDDLILHLRESIADELFSTPEKKTLKSMVADLRPNQDQLNFLRSKVFDLANEKVTEKNYRFIIQWIRNATNAMVLPSPEKSDAFFSPGESCREVILQQINLAINRIDICVFTISDDRITEAITGAHQKGVTVRIITDNDKSLDLGSDIQQMSRGGIAIKMDGTPNHMHHKFMVVDSRSLLTGSYNWTRSAARFNHENVLVTRESGAVRAFQDEFERLWKEMNFYA
jgi:mitochondrial cardiolipin hydrolase